MTAWLVRLSSTTSIKWVGFALLGVAAFVFASAAMGNASGIVRRYWVRYTAALERSLRALFVFVDGGRIATIQIACAIACGGLAVATGTAHWALGIVAAAFGPWLWIKRRQRQRTEAAEAQLATFLQLFANSLRATPSIGQALAMVAPSLEAPLRDELELALKQCKVGSPLDQALLAMATRLRSRALDASITTILIGRQIGGDLPKILDSTAASLRELFRLEAVVKTKTADSKNQLLVLTVMPIVLVFGMNAVNPGYFTPLTADLMGVAVVVVASLLWVGSLALARKLLAVDV